LEGLALFALLRIVTHRRLGLARPGLVAGVWLLGYGGARIVCEVFREPETGHALNIGPVTAGQLFSAPMIAFGIYLVRTAARPATVIGKTA
jgi:phosphatidylglycerol:prolipoprotein diacylglycerol transferase